MHILIITKKHYLFHIKCEFKLIFNKDIKNPIQGETDFYGNNNPIILKRYFLYQTVKIIAKAQIFSHIDEMINTTVNVKCICQKNITSNIQCLWLKDV